MKQSSFALFGAFELGIHEGQPWEKLTFAWSAILVASLCILILYSLVFSEIYPSSLLIMPKACTKYSKKRKFHGNQHLNKKNAHISEDNGFPLTADINTSNSASAWKIPLPKHSKSPDCGIPSTDPSITGFRFVDMEKLDSVFRLLLCNECYKCSLILQEQTLKRKGCASHLCLFWSVCSLWYWRRRRRKNVLDMYKRDLVLPYINWRRRKKKWVGKADW